ncbi:hypothetical protein GCM10020221_32250 [Streptomyces thioluteus]|uniref:Uncharacterized protein n=1 Tax=Streptomyces thioluteus TaxID=66431 RepID=A0ABP6JKT4_STRTU
MARVNPTSRGSGPASPVTRASRRAACRRSPAGVFAERTQGATGAGSAASDAGPSGAASRITWALVPLMPKDETADRRGRSSSGQSRCAVRRPTAPDSQSTWCEGVDACRVRGMMPWRIACTILMIPATPAAAWVCPMLDFSEPSHNGRSSGRSWP